MTAGFADPDAQAEADALARAILTRRRIKCRVNGNHTDGGKCPACGL